MTKYTIKGNSPKQIQVSQETEKLEVDGGNVKLGVGAKDSHGLHRNQSIQSRMVRTRVWIV